MEEISQMSDSGTPFVISMPESMPIVQLYNEIAANVDTELSELAKSDIGSLEAKYDPVQGKVLIEGPAEGAERDGERRMEVKKMIDPYVLRLACKCALCVDEVDGSQILKVEEVPKDVYPKNMIRKGNYAVAVIWSDGHNSSISEFLKSALLSYTK